jgi:hypothetical protein
VIVALVAPAKHKKMATFKEQNFFSKIASKLVASRGKNDFVLLRVGTCIAGECCHMRNNNTSID